MDQGMNTLGVFLNQEVVRFRELLKYVKKSLKEVLSAIKGEVVMSAALQTMHGEILFNRVPSQWERFSYPSLASLSDWTQDLIRRVKFISSWLLSGPPTVYWLSSFFFPQGFMTAVLQKHARATKIAIDLLDLETRVLPDFTADKLKAGPATGAYIYGLFLQGADWNSAQSTLTEQQPGRLFTQMPVIWLDPQLRTSARGHDDKLYDCPVYKTSTRRGELSTTGHSTNFVLYLQLPSLNVSSDHWIRRGAAILLQTD